MKSEAGNWENIMKMAALLDAASLCGKSINFCETTRRNTTESCHLYPRRREHLKSYGERFRSLHTKVPVPLKKRKKIMRLYNVARLMLSTKGEEQPVNQHSSICDKKNVGCPHGIDCSTSTLKTELIRSIKTLMTTYKFTWRHNARGHN
jgi:hypothetical protein